MTQDLGVDGKVI